MQSNALQSGCAKSFIVETSTDQWHCNGTLLMVKVIPGVSESCVLRFPESLVNIDCIDCIVKISDACHYKWMTIHNKLPVPIQSRWPGSRMLQCFRKFLAGVVYSCLSSTRMSLIFTIFTFAPWTWLKQEKFMIWNVLSLQYHEKFPRRGVLIKKSRRSWTTQHRLETSLKPETALSKFSWQAPELRYCKTGVNNSTVQDAFDLSVKVVYVTKINGHLLGSSIIVHL